MAEKDAIKMVGSLVNNSLKNSETVEEYKERIEKGLSHNNDKLANGVEKYQLQHMIDNGLVRAQQTFKTEVKEDVIDIPTEDKFEDFLESSVSTPGEVIEEPVEEVEVSKVLSEEFVEDFDTIEEDLLELSSPEEVLEELPIEVEEIVEEAELIGSAIVDKEEIDEIIPEELPDLEFEKPEEMPVNEFEIMEEVEPVEFNESELEEYGDKEFLNDYKQYGLTVGDIIKLKANTAFFSSEGKNEELEKQAKEVMTKVFNNMSGVMGGEMLEQEIEEFYEGLGYLDVIMTSGLTDYQTFLRGSEIEETPEVGTGYDHDAMLALIKETENRYDDEAGKITTKTEELYEERERIRDIKLSLKQKEKDLEKMKDKQDMEALEEKLQLENDIYELQTQEHESKQKINVYDSEIAKRSADLTLIEEELSLKERMAKMDEEKYSGELSTKKIEEMFTDRYYAEMRMDTEYFANNKDTLKSIASILQLKGMEKEADTIYNLISVDEDKYVCDKVPAAENLVELGLDRGTLEVTANKLAKLEKARQDKNNLHAQAKLFAKNNLGKQKHTKGKKDIFEHLKYGKYNDLHASIEKTIENVESKLDELKPKKRIAYENAVRMLKAFDEQYVMPLATADVENLPYGETAKSINELLFLNAHNKIDEQTKEKIEEEIKGVSVTGIEYVPGKYFRLGTFTESEINADRAGELFKAYDRL